jgi:hypothetical protein
MTAKGQFLQRFGRRAKFVIAAVCGLGLMTVPVLAQFGQFGNRGSSFDSFFSPYMGPRAPSERSVDSSRAPSPRKLDAQPAGGSVLVLGDSMADWLAFGLEDALGDPPDLSVVRKNRASSGLIRYEGRNEKEDWPGVIRETIAASKPNYIVMMLGLNDRISIRDRVSAVTTPTSPGAKTPAANAAAKPSTPAGGETAEKSSTDAKPDPSDAEQSPPDVPVIAAPEPPPKNSVTTTTYRIHEFRSDEWAASYTKRIDATIAALKSAGVPVFWVGLPSIRGPRATSDMQYLDDLYRARAEKAGINYIDVWDGFVDESGRFAQHGPDFEGQTRRLRAGDGVHFTKAGARKLAHYLEREIRRVMAPGSEPVALPSSEPQAPAVAAKPSGPAARPLAGPVVPLTASVSSAQELIGGRDTSEVSTVKSVIRVLVNGEAVSPPAGRSDDFKWPRRTIAPIGSDPVVATTTEPIPVMKPAPQTTVAAPNAETRPVASANPAPRRTATSGRAQQPSRSQSFFSFFR